MRSHWATSCSRKEKKKSENLRNKKSENNVPEGAHADTVKAHDSISDFSKRLNDLHGEIQKNSFCKILFLKCLRAIFAVISVLTLLAAIALLPISIVMLIICLGQIVMPLI